MKISLLGREQVYIALAVDTSLDLEGRYIFRSNDN
jgi:hypothetical protein